MNTIKSTIHTEAIFSDDEQHCYLHKKTWDEKKSAYTVITMYLHLDGILSLDLTTVRTLNQLSTENLKHKKIYNKPTDIHIMKAVSESEKIILAYDAYAKRPSVEKHVKQVIEILKPQKKKVKKIINPTTNEIMHPLNPKVRQKWTLK